MERTSVFALALMMAACTPAAAPEAAVPADARNDVLGLLDALAEAPPINGPLVERTLHVRLAPRGSGVAGKRSLSHGSLSAAIFNGSMTITLPGELPDTPCVISIGEFLDSADALGFETNFYDLGTKPAWTLTKDVAGGRSVGLNVMTTPLTKPGERLACVGYISAGTEASDEQAIP